MGADMDYYTWKMAGANGFLLQPSIAPEAADPEPSASLLLLPPPGASSGERRRLRTDHAPGHVSGGLSLSFQAHGQQGDWRAGFEHHFTSSHERLWEVAGLTAGGLCEPTRAASRPSIPPAPRREQRQWGSSRRPHRARQGPHRSWGPRGGGGKVSG